MKDSMKTPPRTRDNQSTGGLTRDTPPKTRAEVTVETQTPRKRKISPMRLEAHPRIGSNAEAEEIQHHMEPAATQCYAPVALRGRAWAVKEARKFLSKHPVSPCPVSAVPSRKRNDEVSVDLQCRPGRVPLKPQRGKWTPNPADAWSANTVLSDDQEESWASKKHPDAMVSMNEESIPMKSGGNNGEAERSRLGGCCRGDTEEEEKAASVEAVTVEPSIDIKREDEPGMNVESRRAKVEADFEKDLAQVKVSDKNGSLTKKKKPGKQLSVQSKNKKKESVLEWNSDLTSLDGGSKELQATKSTIRKKPMDLATSDGESNDLRATKMAFRKKQMAFEAPKPKKNPRRKAWTPSLDDAWSGPPLAAGVDGEVADLVTQNVDPLETNRAPLKLKLKLKTRSPLPEPSETPRCPGLGETPTILEEDAPHEEQVPDAARTREWDQSQKSQGGGPLSPVSSLGETVDSLSLSDTHEILFPYHNGHAVEVETLKHIDQTPFLT